MQGRAKLEQASVTLVPWCPLEEQRIFPLEEPGSNKAAAEFPWPSGFGCFPSPPSPCSPRGRGRTSPHRTNPTEAPGELRFALPLIRSDRSWAGSTERRRNPINFPLPSRFRSEPRLGCVWRATRSRLGGQSSFHLQMGQGSPTPEL